MKTYLTLTLLVMAGLSLVGCTDPLRIEKHYTENTQTTQTVDSPVTPLYQKHAQPTQQVKQANDRTPRSKVTVEETVESEEIILQ